MAEAEDRDSNPVVTLARRVMEPLLSDVRDKVAVDIGCGSGHDLELLASRGAKAIGFDFTSDVLCEAAKRRSVLTRLVQADATSLPLQEGTADLIVCSFVLSQVADVTQLAEQLERIAVPGADVYVVDMHPEAQRHGWRAAVDATFDPAHIAIHELTKIKQAFDLAGFELQSLVEPRLAHPERRYFETVQRPDLYEQARHVPAIYLFHFRRRLLTTDRGRPYLIPRKRQPTWQLVGARHALGPRTAVLADLVVDSTRIRHIYDLPSRVRAQRSHDDGVVDLTGMLLLPGLVNAHDELYAGWPQQVHADVKPWLGALRNLISGVTSVVQREGLDASDMPQFPVRIARNFALSTEHTAEAIATEFAGVPQDVPLVIDMSWCEEDVAASFLATLEQYRLLTSRTILLGLKRPDPRVRELLAKYETSLVWVPTADPAEKEFVEKHALVALGTGCSGETSLGDEIRSAINAQVTPEAVFAMVTARAATVLHLRNGEGRIMAETPADLLVLQDEDGTPAESLCSQSPVGVVLGGKPILIKDTLRERVPESLRDPLRAITIDDELWWAEEHIVAAVRGAGQGLRVGRRSVKAIS